MSIETSCKHINKVCDKYYTEKLLMYGEKKITNKKIDYGTKRLVYIDDKCHEGYPCQHWCSFEINGKFSGDELLTANKIVEYWDDVEQVILKLGYIFSHFEKEYIRCLVKKFGRRNWTLIDVHECYNKTLPCVHRCSIVIDGEKYTKYISGDEILLHTYALRETDKKHFSKYEEYMKKTN